MKVLLPFLKLYRRYIASMLLGMLLALVTLLASLFLLSLSGWFLAATAAVGFAGLYTFNYMLPAAGVRGAAILRTVSRYAERLVSHNTTFKILSFLRTLAFNKILPLSPAQLQQYQKADLLNRFIADIDHLDHFYLKLLSPLISALLVTATIFVSLSYFDYSLACLISIVLLATILITPFIFYRAGKPIGQQLAQQKSDYRQHVVGYLQGQAELTLFSAQARFRQQLDAAEAEWLVSQKRQSTLNSLAQSLILMIIGLLTAAVLWLCIGGIDHYDSPISALFVFICLASGEMLAPIPGAFVYLGQVIASATRVTQLFEQKSTILFPTEGKPAISDKIAVTLTNICFNYPKQMAPILDNASIWVDAGQHIALIGQTGCGKSTTLKLITRDWDPQQGQILLNGIDIKAFDEPTLRSMMAVVPQRIDILSDTLRNNLLIGDIKATDMQLIEVLKQVELDKLLDSEAGLSIWLGESGRTLSGGEKRRIGIARALLHQAPLVLMDEPTESLDSETEAQIIQLIGQVYANKTLLMVTHRLTQHQMFDRVYRLDEGHYTATS
ncbi:cysteine/glutathione ABC transporter ATP-binding protein/permease CydC [Utexia brackfieldae]|uniref:heme ABC transporter ATP-binding protein/permease CydC n=1 Tax=Utexia brackfieldae TaxID=3074108 RepID=UPI00370D5BA9